MVRTPISRRTGATTFIDGWWIGANMKPMPVCSMAAATCAGCSSMAAPSASTASALPDLDDTLRLPCLATRAPIHHPSMKVVAPVRREMGVRTIFNILGPLTNPASAPSVLMGVFHPDLVGIQARVLRELGTERAMVVWGRDNMDEISLGAGTLVGELRDGKVREYEIHPEDFGIAMSASRNLRVDGPEQSIAMLRAVLDNEPGPALDIVALNAGAALYVAGVASDIGDGLARARAVIADGSARARLQQYVDTTRALVA